MDDLRLPAVAARVVAWHNRHPLARRITAAQVMSVGYVAFGADAAFAAVPAMTGPMDPTSVERELAQPSPVVPVEVAEVDYAEAFAALSEHAAAPDTAVPEVAEVQQDAATESVTAQDLGDQGFEIELDVSPEGGDAPVGESHAAGESLAEQSSEAAPTLEEPARQSSEAVATLEEPAPAASPTIAAPAALPAATLRERMLARSSPAAVPAPSVTGGLLVDHPGYAPAVVEVPQHAVNFMAPLSPDAIANWVARHGRLLQEPPRDGPLRRVNPALLPPGLGPGQGAMVVLTAAIEGGALRSRVLVGAGDPGEVLGERLWSRPRLALAGGLLVVLLAAGAFAAGSLLRSDKAASARAETLAVDAAKAGATVASAASAASAVSAASAASAPPVASAASAAAPGSTASGGPEGPEGATPTEDAAPAPTRQEHAPALPVEAPLTLTTQRPAPAYAQKGRLPLPSRGMALSEEDKAAARDAVAAARMALGQSPTTPRPAAPMTSQTPPAAPTAAPTGPAVARPTGSGVPVFAVSTRSLRTRAEAELLQSAIGALLRSNNLAGISVELIPEGEDWRVAAWPFASQADAERARALLAARGMRVEALGF